MIQSQPIGRSNSPAATRSASQGCRFSRSGSAALRRTRAPRKTAVAACRPEALTDASRRDLLVGSAATAGLLLGVDQADAAGSVWDLKAYQYDKEISLDKFKGQNSNYPSLRTLYQKYKDQGFTLLAFSCNQFGGQAPRSSQGEREFAYKKFGIEFPVMDKIEVNGEKVHPVYKLLRDALPNSLPSAFSPFGFPLPGEKGKIEWNYVKFLVDREGKPVRRYTSTFDPIKAEDDLRLVLAGKPPRPEKCVGKPDQAGCKPDL